LLVVGRRRRPIDGRFIGQADSYVAKRGGVIVTSNKPSARGARCSATTSGSAVKALAAASLLSVVTGLTSSSRSAEPAPLRRRDPAP
jgi:hypothetical protein